MMHFVFARLHLGASFFLHAFEFAIILIHLLEAFQTFFEVVRDLNTFLLGQLELTDDRPLLQVAL